MTQKRIELSAKMKNTQQQIDLFIKLTKIKLFLTGTSIRSSISRPTRSRKSKKVSDTEVSDTTASSAEELTTIWSEKAAEQQRKNASKL